MTLRYAVRTDGRSGFVFINNFQDHRSMPGKENETVIVETAEETYRFAFSLAAGENAVLPFHFDMDGIMLLQATAQPVLRTVIGGRVTYVFMIPEGMEASFRFEEKADVKGSGEFFTLRKGDKSVDVITVSRERANRMFLLQDGSLIFTDAALLEDDKGGLRVETTESMNALQTYPANRLSGSSAAVRLPDQGVFGEYHIAVAERKIPLDVQPAAPHRWTVQFPRDAFEGLKDVRLQIRYQGDIGTLWLNNVMIADNFCNGDVWETGLTEYRDAMDTPFVLNIAPVREGARVNVDSAMAARNETVSALVAEIESIQAQPVYEVTL